MCAFKMFELVTGYHVIISKKYSTMHDMCGQKSLKVEKLLLTLQTLIIPFYFNKGKYFSMYAYSGYFLIHTTYLIHYNRKRYVCTLVLL